MTVGGVESTQCFVGSPERPLQVVRVRLASPDGRALPPLTVTVAGGALHTPPEGVGAVPGGPAPGTAPGAAPGTAPGTGPGPGTAVAGPVPKEAGGAAEDRPGDGDVVVEVGLAGYDAYPVGTVVPVVVTASDGHEEVGVPAQVTTAETGWTLWMVPHFHYDPVWWNTQAAYTARWDDLPGAQAWRNEYQHTAFALVGAYLEAARQDPDYRFVLAEVDYLKPYWDAVPEDRPFLRRLLAEGRLEVVGGMYNEPNTNLTSPESTVRNAVYGLGFQRAVMGAHPETAWQLDAFGHDPQFPGIMRAAGLAHSSWARGPYHQWGPVLNPGGPRGDPRRMQFPSEFRWIAPGGGELVTSYMTDHYSIGFWMDAATTLAEAEREVYATFCELQRVAATRNVLLPVGTDHSRPNRWVTEIARDWAGRYVWPRFVCATPREFFAAVRAESRDGAALWPQTRDMNPVYTGKDVSYIDVKQAQRATENLLVQAETFATLAGIVAGTSYPDAAVDRAWRQLVYGAHHDAVTGTCSDQVYLDLLAGWREAHDLARTVHDAAVRAIASQVDTRIADAPDARTLVVVNPLSWPRTDLVTAHVTFPEPGLGSVAVHGPDGEPVPAVAEDVRRYRGGGLAEVRLTFLARDVPGVGYATFSVRGSDAPLDTWRAVPGATGSSDAFALTLDPARGGGVASLVDRAHGRELVARGDVGDLRLYDEYAAHPRFGEGPWHLLPTGTVRSSADAPASVTVEASVLGARCTAIGTLGSLTHTSRYLLAHGTGRVDVRTTVDGFVGTDQLLRMRLPCDLPGALPVSEVGYAAVGRGFATPEVDTAAAPWTLDNPAYTWFGLSSTARVRVSGFTRAVGVAEVVAPEPVVSAGGADDLLRALARVGVTATCSVPEWERYGSLDVDSNLPDVRFALGGPEVNAFTARVLAEAGPGYAAELARQLDEGGVARVWVPARRALREVRVPNADLRGPRDLPVLVVAGRDGPSLAAAVAALAADLDDATVDVGQDPHLPVRPDGEPPDPGHTVAVLNRGLPGFAVDAGGALYLSLFRSCTGWPSGVWIDPPKRSTPDGSGFQAQHWTHAFDYAFVSGAGDWRDAGAVRHGRAHNHPLVPCPTGQHPGRLPARGTLVGLSPGSAVLAALKPTGNPLATGSARRSDPAAGVTLRLYEAHGRPVRVRFDGLVPLTDLRAADLTETPTAPADGAADGTDGVTLSGAGIATVLARPAGAPADPPAAETGGGARPPGTAAGEPARSVYTRYWLHNGGSAPVGNLPLAVHLHPTEVAVDGPFTLRVTVASDLVDGPQHTLVRVAAPPGWRVDPAERPVSLAPGAVTAYPVRVTPPPDVPGGTYVVSAAGEGVDGQHVHDVTVVSVGPPQVPFGREVSLSLDADRVVLAPGDRLDVPVTVRNGLRSSVTGELHAVSPWGTWDLLYAADHPPSAAAWFALDAGETRSVPFVAHAPLGTPPGAYWLLVRAGYAGRVAYTRTVPVEVLGR